MINAEDKKVLRKTAEVYKTASEECDFAEKVALYKGVNDLKMIRPVVLMDELPWHELNVDGALDLECEDEFLRGVEQYMKRAVLQWRHFPCDRIITPYIPVKKVIIDSGIGMSISEKTLATSDENTIVAHEFYDQLASESDVLKLKNPVISYDEESTLAQYDLLSELIGDIIDIKLIGVNSYVSIWDTIAHLRGVTPLLYDLAERPEHTHHIVSRLTEINLEYTRQYEELNLFEPEPLILHCTAACTDSLKPDHEKVLTKDCWGRGMAQIFAHVSKDMHKEFDIDYMKKIMSKFGLVYYGCCEPLHHKIDILEQLPNLRKISITPWADVDIAASIIGNKYVLSAKPNPALLATGLDVEVLRRDIGKIIKACYDNNVSFEFVLKDVSTVGGNPENLFLWEKTVMSMVKNC